MIAGQVLPFVANWMWLRSSSAGYRRFLRSLEEPGPAQEQYLKDLLRRNAETCYGRVNGFSGIASVADFQRTVPLSRYEDYLPYIEEISRGEPRVLTHDPVVLFQPTSGTSSASKLIPYARSLRAEYQNAIAPWIYSVYRRAPGLMKGKAYWSVSPDVKRAARHGTIPVGFDDDSEYLGALGKRLYGMVSVGHGGFGGDVSEDDFWDLTLVELLAARNLALVSVWSPTFLLALARRLTDNWPAILEGLRTCGSPGRRARAEEIRRTIRERGVTPEAVWPDLKLISCWTHGASETCIPALRGFFPNVEIQGKGLIATEAFVSLPLVRDEDPVLAVNSHFFEFRDVRNGEIRLAHQLQKGDVYSVIVTTGGGLYRYQMDDLVQVTGRAAATPMFRFVCRDGCSDLFGEKLSVEHVQRSVARGLAECSLDATFFLLAPVRSSGGKVSYALFLHARGLAGGPGRKLRDRLEDLLLENFHYAYCRRLGQLDRLRVFRIDCPSPEVGYLQEMNRRGQRLGDVKPSVLDREFGWDERFRGRFLESDN